MLLQYNLALKIDVDTYRGTKRGVDSLLRVLSRQGIRATFFVSLGPDCSGRAIARLFRKRGFLGKMVRTNPAKCYGIETMLRGTLLPPIQIGRCCTDEIALIRSEGHEVAIHAWNHVRWQDTLPWMSRGQIRAEFERAYECYEAIFDARPRACGAPGWICSDKSLAVQDTLGFHYCSDTRGVNPFFPIMQGQTFRTLQIPTTLPTLDEELGRDGATIQNFNARLIALLRSDSFNVYTLHAETEGVAFVEDFEHLLEMMRGYGVRFMTLSEVANIALRSPTRIPQCAVQLRAIPGRAGVVACQTPKR